MNLFKWRREKELALAAMLDRHLSEIRQVPADAAARDYCLAWVRQRHERMRAELREMVLDAAELATAPKLAHGDRCGFLLSPASVVPTP